MPPGLWSGFGGAGGGIAHFAHLGGYAGAFLYLKWLERSRTGFRQRAVAGGPAATRRFTKAPTIDIGRVHEVNRDEVNRILDKINAQGIASLSPEEQVFLSHFAAPDDKVPPPS